MKGKHHGSPTIRFWRHSCFSLPREGSSKLIFNVNRDLWMSRTALACVSPVRWRKRLSTFCGPVLPHGHSLRQRNLDVLDPTSGPPPALRRLPFPGAQPASSSLPSLRQPVPREPRREPQRISIRSSRKSQIHSSGCRGVGGLQLFPPYLAQEPGDRSVKDENCEGMCVCVCCA